MEDNPLRMALTGVALHRVTKELRMLFEDPPPGISAWAREEDSREVEAVVTGVEGTPYADGRFRLLLSIPQRYPFEPPKVHYTTPIYHPNIDSAGRICLDILNLPPKGAWKPSLNISTVLQSLQLLMSEPNPEDGLMVDITHQYINDYARFERTAKENTRKHAMGDDSAAALAASASSDSSAAAGAPAAASGEAQPSLVGALAADAADGAQAGAGAARTEAVAVTGDAEQPSGAMPSAATSSSSGEGDREEGAGGDGTQSKRPKLV